MRATYANSRCLVEEPRQQGLWHHVKCKDMHQMRWQIDLEMIESMSATVAWKTMIEKYRRLQITLWRAHKTFTIAWTLNEGFRRRIWWYNSRQCSDTVIMGWSGEQPRKPSFKRETLASSSWSWETALVCVWPELKFSAGLNNTTKPYMRRQ